MEGMDALMPKDRHSGSSLENGLTAALRDPFQVVLEPGAITDALNLRMARADSDLLAEIVRGLKLDATFLQGRDQMAMINGRVYSKGQSLLLDGNLGDSSPTLVVVNVLPAKVILGSGDRNYVLGYPDQLGGRADKSAGTGRGQSPGAAMARGPIPVASSRCSRSS